MSNRRRAETEELSALQGIALRRRSGTVAAPGLGSPRDQAGSHGISAAPTGLSLLSDEHLRRAASGRAIQPGRSAAEGSDWRILGGVLVQTLGSASLAGAGLSHRRPRSSGSVVNAS